MRRDVFFDTNLIVYFASVELQKAARSAELLRKGGVVSVQVLNEFANVTLRKQRIPFETVRTALAAVRAACAVVPLSIETHERGLKIAERHRLAVYDAMIIAAASVAGCTTLYSEDMHDGHVIEGVRIKNPFA